MNCEINNNDTDNNKKINNINKTNTINIINKYNTNYNNRDNLSSSSSVKYTTTSGGSIVSIHHNKIHGLPILQGV